MFQKKAVAVFFLFLAVNLLAANELNKALYKRTTLLELGSIPWDSPRELVEYNKADVRFVRSFTRWGRYFGSFTVPIAASLDIM